MLDQLISNLCSSSSDYARGTVELKKASSKGSVHVLQHTVAIPHVQMVNTQVCGLVDCNTNLDDKLSSNTKHECLAS